MIESVVTDRRRKDYWVDADILSVLSVRVILEKLREEDKQIQREILRVVQKHN